MNIYTLTIHHYDTANVTYKQLEDIYWTDVNGENYIEQILSFSNKTKAIKVYNNFKKDYLKYSIVLLKLEHKKLRTDLNKKELLLQIFTKKGFLDWYKTIYEFNVIKYKYPIIEKFNPEIDKIIEQHNNDPKNQIANCRYNPKNIKYDQ